MWVIRDQPAVGSSSRRTQLPHTATARHSHWLWPAQPVAISQHHWELHWDRCQGQPWAEAVHSMLFLPVLFCPVLFPIYLYLQKNPEDDSSGKTLSWEPGHLLLTIYTVRSIEQLLPFFNVLSQVFNSKVTSRCVGHSGSPVLYPNCFPTKDIKMENLKPSSKARQKIEEMVEKDFLEGIIKTWTHPVPRSLYVM